MKRQIKSKEWLSPNSDAFLALQEIVTSKSVLKDLKHLTKFSHTGTLEIFHSLYSKWIPKSQHFSYLGMVMRSQLAVLDFNQGSDLEQAKTKTGEKKYNVGFSKITKTWSAKPIKTKKDTLYLKNMVKETIDCAASKPFHERPVIPIIPKNIASAAKPDKNEIIKNQISRFNEKM